MMGARCTIVELRQYTLNPGQRDVLINLFDREFIESQEAAGMTVFGQFRDLDDPDRFVWLRGFEDMPRRAEALSRFYYGPVWKAHKDEANATMIDSDNVLLLRPVAARYDLPAAAVPRPPIAHTAPPSSRILATLYYRDRPFDEVFVDFFDREMCPALFKTGATPLACLQTEHAENTFPALPVRVGENVFAWFAKFPSPTHLSDHLKRLEHSDRWQGQILPTLAAMHVTASQQMRLAPTARSLMR